MKVGSSWKPLALIFVVCLTGFVRSRYCECSYHPGGCVIKVAAPVGFKCECRYKGAWTCSGTAYSCDDNEQCPGNLADYCACKLGGGNCGGYYSKPNDCKYSGRPKIGVAGKASCDCSYSPGGCAISEAAPFGWKCVCSYKGFWTCLGWPQQCNANEVCLGEDYSYCGCKQGGGGCGGYQKKTNCPSYYISTTCNCNKASDWKNGIYIIDEVTYDYNSLKLHSSRPIVLAEKNIDNYSRGIQTITLEVGETLRHTSSFTRTQGIAIETGTEFKAGIPNISEGSHSFSITKSFSHTYGKTESFASTFSAAFTCNGAPHMRTKCSVSMQKGRVDVPYTMTVKHKIISNCECKSYGVWTGTQAYNAKLSSTEMEPV